MSDPAYLTPAERANVLTTAKRAADLPIDVADVEQIIREAQEDATRSAAKALGEIAAREEARAAKYPDAPALNARLECLEIMLKMLKRYPEARRARLLDVEVEFFEEATAAAHARFFQPHPEDAKALLAAQAALNDKVRASLYPDAPTPPPPVVTSTTAPPAPEASLPSNADCRCGHPRLTDHGSTGCLHGCTPRECMGPR